MRRIELIATRMLDVREHWGGEAILPFSYGGIERPPDAGHPRRDAVSQVRHIAARAHGMHHTHGRRGAALRKDALGHLRGLSGRAYLVPLWGVNPSTSGIHLVPYVREAQKAGARLIVIDPRSTPLARQADLHLAPQARVS